MLGERHMLLNEGHEDIRDNCFKIPSANSERLFLAMIVSQCNGHFHFVHIAGS